MARHDRFEWDAEKARQNLAKHGVSFDDAAHLLVGSVFDAKYQVEEYDAIHSTEDEDRWITSGLYPFDPNIALRVAWTERYDENGSITRIISARHMTPRERLEYAQEIRPHPEAGQ